MSNIERFENLKQVVKLVEPQFNELASIHKAVNYKREASFALQLLGDSNYLSQIAMSNQDSLKRAIVNVAAIGLSLSPTQKLAYLVPRDGKVCLDISYRGYTQLAYDIGSIKWVMAEIVYDKDEYAYVGMNREPIHKFNPFVDRGEILGGYCLAKTHDGEYILVQMPAKEILDIRDRSQSYRAHAADKSKSTPWVTDTNEMIKKTLIKRAAKSWPMSDTRKRFEHAIDVTNEVDPIDFTLAPPLAIEKKSQRDADIEMIREHLKTISRSEEKFIDHMTRVCRREIKNIEDLTELEASNAIIMLEEFVDQKKEREK